jgi:hypothetical protein
LVQSAISDLVDEESIPIGVVPPGLTLSLRRGDTRADGEIGVADAMYVAQHLAGLRPACSTVVDLTCAHSVNAASARHGGDFDRITMADAQSIAELLVGLRSGDYLLKP